MHGQVDRVFSKGAEFSMGPFKVSCIGITIHLWILKFKGSLQPDLNSLTIIMLNISNPYKKMSKTFYEINLNVNHNKGLLVLNFYYNFQS